MSNTPDEWNDHIDFIIAACNNPGPVLITGLGLGMVSAALIRAGIPSIDVVEINHDVINLAAGHYAKLAKKHGVEFRVHHADACKWKPDRQFDHAWHDIWQDLSSDNLDEMQAMRKHYRSHMTAPGRQLCWGESFIKQQLRSRFFW